MLQSFNWKWKSPTAALLGLLAVAAHAQTQDYHVSEDYQADPATADAGPVRMARISFIEGSVSWRPGSDGDWAAASVNLPIRQGAQIWVSDHARAEIQFDDGSIARLGSASRSDGGVLTLQTLYSDSKGEFTELSLSSGLIALRLMNAQSLYQVDTSAITAKAYGPAKFRVGVGQGVEVVDRNGEVSVQNNGTSGLTLEPRDSVFAADVDAAVTAVTAPMEDSFDQFVDTRDDGMIGHAGYVPPNIAVCAGDLGNAGSWRSGEYGQTWYPQVAPGWTPYHYGHWVFVRPFGWTWVADESWGWAPYHYGTWVSTSYGWGWVPGPAQQCWSPAVVHFSSYNGQVAWCALAPSEVHYAAVGINLGGGVSLGFSIGSVGCYYPANNAYCVPRTFNNIQVNRVTTVTNITTINNYYGATTATSTHFVPRNASASGASFVSADGFGHGGAPQLLARNQTAAFSQGQSMVPQGNRVLSGPPGVQVSHESFTPTHSFTSSAPPATVLNRPLLRPNLPPTIANISAPTRTQFVTPHPSQLITPSPRQSFSQPIRPNPIVDPAPRQPNNVGSSSRQPATNPNRPAQNRPSPNQPNPTRPNDSRPNFSRPSQPSPSQAGSGRPSSNRPTGSFGGSRPAPSRTQPQNRPKSQPKQYRNKDKSKDGH